MAENDWSNDKYRLYGIFFDNGSLMKVHFGRPISFKNFIDIVLQHPELTVESTNQKLETNKIIGIQKIPNGNTPEFELTLGGVLKNI